MQGDRAVELLIEHQIGISALLRSSSDILAPDTPKTLDAVAALRWQLMRALRAYQFFKHGEIFDPLMQCADPAISTSARILKDRCLAIGDEYTAFVTRWGSGASASAWHDYRIEARRMVLRIEEHLSTERDQVRALTSRFDRTRRIKLPDDQSGGSKEDR